MFIDTHCHLSYEDYDDINLVIEENRAANVEKIIISGCSKAWIDESLKLADLYNDVYVTLGYHPSEVDVVTDEMLIDLKKQLLNKKVVGLGEIGLDYYYGKDNKEQQVELFEKQLKIAEDMNLIVVIHSRDATEDTINCLKKFNVKGVIHCFSGSVETAKIYTSMGYMLGIGGVVTFKNSNLYKVIEFIGLDNIILETDAPYLAPVPVRGKINSSKYVPYIGKRIAEILNLEEEEVAKTTTSNAIELFDLK